MAVCKMCVKHEDGVTLWSGPDEMEIRIEAAKTYKGQTLSFGTPRWVTQ